MFMDLAIDSGIKTPNAGIGLKIETSTHQLSNGIHKQCSWNIVI